MIKKLFNNKNTLKGFLTISTFLISLLILVFMSAPAIHVSDKTYTALEMISGYSLNKTKMYGFSFVNLIPYIILGIILIFEYLKYIINIFNNRTTRIIMTIGFVIIGVMLLLSKYMLNDINPGAGFNILPKETAWGTILQASIAFVCAIFSAIDAIVEFEDENNHVENISNEVDDLKSQYIEELKKINKTDEEE